jgi:hypothetical protein
MAGNPARLWASQVKPMCCGQLAACSALEVAGQPVCELGDCIRLGAGTDIFEMVAPDRSLSLLFNFVALLMKNTQAFIHDICVE